MYDSQKKYTTEQGNKNRFLGRAAEHRVMAELLLRDINIAPVDIDEGIDLITIETGKKLQIKASKSEISTTRTYSYPVYVFPLSQKTREIADFLILWCVDHDWFYIIPKKEMTKSNVNIPIEPERVSKYQQFLNAWDLLKEI